MTTHRSTASTATALGAAAVTALLALSGCGGGSGDASSPSPSSSSSSSSDSAAAADGHTDQDVMFAQMMIPHHAQANEMSDMVLAKDGVDQRVLDLATSIKAEQQPEIDTMSGWLEQWGEEVPATDGSMTGMDDMEGMEGMDHGSMGGMMSEEDMRALADADGPAASRLFLEQMVEHHGGAIDMARTQVEEGSYPDAVELAQTIVDSQQAEVEEMTQLLAAL